MEESTSREKVLKAIRDALVNPMYLPGESEDYANQIYVQEHTEFIDVCFAEAFSAVNGGFVYNSDTRELVANLKSLIQSKSINNLFCFDAEIREFLDSVGIVYLNEDELYKSCEASITGCEFLIARLGSVMMSSARGWGRKGYIYPGIHIVLASRDQLVYDLNHAFNALKEKYPEGLPSMITVVTGPSRTADIEKTLVLGAHGPEELYVFLLDFKEENDE